MRNIKINLDEIEKLAITPSQYVLAYLVHFKKFDEIKTLRKTYKKDLYFKEDMLNLVLSGLMKNPSNDLKSMKVSECEVIGIFTKEEVHPDEEWEAFVTTFRDLFPSGTTSGGYYVKSSQRDCDKKLKEFSKNYPEFDEDTILKATENYINRAKLQNYKYMKIATYFISKDRLSTLASECEFIKSGGTTQSVLTGGV